MDEKKILKSISIVSILSILVSIYLIYLHYTKSIGHFCNFSNLFSCDIVNKSVYSLFPPKIGIPVSILGLIFFTIILVLTRIVHKNQEEKEIVNHIFILTILSLIFAFYLVITEAFIIQSFCIFCLILDVLIIINFLLSYRLKHQIHA